MNEAEMFASLVEAPAVAPVLDRLKHADESWTDYRAAMLATLPAGLLCNELADAARDWRALILGTGARSC